MLHYGAGQQDYKLQDTLTCPSLQGQAGEVNYFYRFGMLGSGSGRQDATLPAPVGRTPRPASLGGLPPRPRRGEQVPPGAPVVSPSSCPRRGVGWGRTQLCEWPAGPSVTLEGCAAIFSPPIAHHSLYYKYINHNVSTKAKFNFLLSAVIWAGWYMAGCAQLIYYPR